jgi:hypothetical protein
MPVANSIFRRKIGFVLQEPALTILRPFGTGARATSKGGKFIDRHQLRLQAKKAPLPIWPSSRKAVGRDWEGDGRRGSAGSPTEIHEGKAAKNFRKTTPCTVTPIINGRAPEAIRGARGVDEFALYIVSH